MYSCPCVNTDRVRSMPTESKVRPSQLWNVELYAKANGNWRERYPWNDDVLNSNLKSGHVLGESKEVKGQENQGDVGREVEKLLVGTERQDLSPVEGSGLRELKRKGK